MVPGEPCERAIWHSLKRLRNSGSALAPWLPCFWRLFRLLRLTVMSNRVCSSPTATVSQGWASTKDSTSRRTRRWMRKTPCPQKRATSAKSMATPRKTAGGRGACRSLSQPQLWVDPAEKPCFAKKKKKKLPTSCRSTIYRLSASAQFSLSG